ncbi:MAG: hypothetical protein ACSHX0_10675 [Akkermansiaceae bacterium]
MSRRAKKRYIEQNQSHGGRGRASGVWVWMLRLSCVLGLIVILAGFGVYSWLKSYLHSDNFRVFIGNEVGSYMGAQVEFDLFEWQGMQAQTDGFSAEGGDLVQLLKADGIKAELNLSAVQRGVWEIPDVHANSLKVVIDNRGRSEREQRSSEGLLDEKRQEEKVKANLGFFDKFLPKKTEVLAMDVAHLDLSYLNDQNTLEVIDAAAQVELKNSSGMYEIRLSQGVVNSSWFGSEVKLQHFEGRYKKGSFFLNELKGKVYDRGLLTMDGALEADDFGFVGKLEDVRVEELISENWQKRLQGDLLVNFKVSSSPNGNLLQGDLDLKNGVLTALPILDKIAAYANTQRLRRLNLSEANLKFFKQGDRLELSDIVLASEGLLRMKGYLNIENGRLDGRFKLGVMPGILAHIPGAETKVFTRGDDGLLWSPIRISGTVDQPREDLSERMIAAAYERMFELVPETGQMALKFAHDTVLDLPEKVAETLETMEDATEVLEGGVDVIKDGVEDLQDEILNSGGGLLDLIPLP